MKSQRRLEQTPRRLPDSVRRFTKVILHTSGAGLVLPASVWANNVSQGIDLPVLFGVALAPLLVATAVVAKLGRDDDSFLVGGQMALLVFWGWAVVPLEQTPLFFDFLFGVAAVAFSFWAGSRLKSFVALPAAMSAALAVTSLLIIASAALGLGRVDQNTGWVPEMPAMAGAEPSEPIRDLIVVVVDGYAGPSELPDGIRTDVDSTASTMRAAGYQLIVGAVSNYTVTNLSIPSLLSLDYLPVAVGASSGHNTRRDIISGDTGLLAWLHENGYRVTKFEGGWEEDSCGVAVDRCIVPGFASNRTLHILVDRTPIRGLMSAITKHPYSYAARSIIDRLPEVVAGVLDNGQPDVVWAHLLAPHQPYFLDSACSLRYDANHRFLGHEIVDLKPEEIDLRKIGYGEQIRCVDSLLVALAEETKNSPAIVLITGDHGTEFLGQVLTPPNLWTDREIQERFSILAYAKTDESCGNPPRSLVNIGRFLIKCLTGADLDPLPDRFFIKTWDGRPMQEIDARRLIPEDHNQSDP